MNILTYVIWSVSAGRKGAWTLNFSSQYSSSFHTTIIVLGLKKNKVAVKLDTTFSKVRYNFYIVRINPFQHKIFQVWTCLQSHHHHHDQNTFSSLWKVSLSFFIVKSPLISPASCNHWSDSCSYMFCFFQNVIYVE